MFSRVFSKIRKNQQTKKKSPGNDVVNKDMYAPFTSDGNDPYVVWFVNAHGAMNDVKKSPRPNEDKSTDIDIHAYSIAGNENQCGLMDVVQPQKKHEEFSNFSGKGIDFCIPSVLRSVYYDGKKKSTPVFDSHNAAIQKVKNLYLHTNPIYRRLVESGGFQVMTHPTRYHEYQLYGYTTEYSRRTSKRPMRTAANDTKLSDKMIYGVWLVSTNITILEPLALTSISDDELKSRKENESIKKGNTLYMPPEVMNRINMASRRDGIPLGAEFWAEAIVALKNQYGGLDSHDGTNRDRMQRIRARTALDNLWKTRTTSSHDIIDIFTPFNEVGKKLGFAPLSMYTIDVTCRSNVGELEPPNPNEMLPEMPLEESQNFEGHDFVVPITMMSSNKQIIEPMDTSSHRLSKRRNQYPRQNGGPAGEQEPTINDDDSIHDKNTGSNTGGTKRKLKYWRKRRTIRNKYQHRHKKSKKSGKRNV